MEATGDTLVGSDSFRKLTFEASYPEFLERFSAKSILVRQDGDRLSYLMNDSLYLLYDFSAVPGDTLYIRSPSDLIGSLFGVAYDTVVIETVDTVEIAGQSRRRQKLRSVGPVGSDIGSTVLEGVGSLGAWFFPTFTRVGEDVDVFDGFRCYEDEILGLHKVSEVACDFDNTVVSVQMAATPIIRVYPNPIEDILHVQSPHGQCSALYFQILDLVGRIIYEDNVPTACTIDLRGTLPQVFFIRIFSRGGSDTVIKLLQH